MQTRGHGVKGFCTVGSVAGSVCWLLVMFLESAVYAKHVLIILLTLFIDQLHFTLCSMVHNFGYTVHEHVMM